MLILRVPAGTHEQLGLPIKARISLGHLAWRAQRIARNDNVNRIVRGAASQSFLKGLSNLKSPIIEMGN